jgi:glycosyltransferase involved in cell wall biosynthesis
MNTAGNQKIRIVFGINDFGAGGAERMTARLISHLDPERFECTLITLLPNPDQNVFSELPSFVTVRRFAFSGFADVRSWRELHRYLKEHNPDIVVSSLFFANTIFRVLKPFVGYTSIAREHNTYVDKPFRQQLVDRLLARVSYRLVAVSTTVADFTSRQEHIARDRFVVIHNGIDLLAGEEALAELPSAVALRKELGFAESDTLYLSVARLAPQKNHRLLLEGFALFHREHPESRLALVGNGALRASLEARVSSLGLREAVRFFGHRTDVGKFYKTADFFVSASVIEGMSNAYLEALAAGVPLVSTLTAGTDELLVHGSNGFAIRRSTPEAVHEALAQALSGDRALLSAQAKKTAERFSLHRTVAAYEKLFEEALART